MSQSEESKRVVVCKYVLCKLGNSLTFHLITITWTTLLMDSAHVTAPPLSLNCFEEM